MNETVQIQADTPFTVADWNVDPANNQLQRGEDVTRLEPRVMDVLVYLAQHPGQVVSREELEENVWAGRVVSYDALTATIVKLRKALDDTSKQASLIKTIPKRGYCLVAPVETIQVKPEPTQPQAPNHAQSELTEPHSVPRSTLTDSPRKQPEHERRQVTVLTCELSDSSSNQPQLDPEEQHVLFRLFQDKCANVIKQFGGHIVQYTNGQLTIYFGYPVALEGDTERAIRTALGIIDTVKQLSDSNQLHEKLTVQIGIDSGMVVIGETPGSELHEHMSVVGDTPTNASILKNHAQPNTLVMSEATRRLAEHLFVFEPLGQVKINQNKTINVFRIQDTELTRNLTESRLVESQTPLVGREIETDLLSKRWEHSKTGESQVVCLCSDAGIGKSRIIQNLQDRIKNEIHKRVLLFCSPYHTNSSLYPVITYLEHALDIHSHDDAQQRINKLENLLSNLGLDVAYHAPVFAELLSLPGKEYYPAFNPSPAELKNRTVESLVRLFSVMAENNPLLLVVEDAHWIDPTTRELVELLINELNAHPVLFITSYRPEFDPPWSGYMQATLLRLNRLSKKESTSLVANIVKGKALPVGIMNQILETTDGVPLFIEELTKSVLASETLDESSAKPFSIPDSLQDSLMARLDKLKYSKHIAQLASILGRSFSRRLLSAVSDESEQQLDTALDELIHAELIYKRGVPPDINYEFKHALVQNAAYASMLKSTRQHLHLKIAEALSRQFPQISKSQPEVLAHHYTEAQQVETAIEYWIRAGQRASEHSANIEAIVHLNKGLELVELLPRGHGRTELELRLLLVLGPALLSAKGLGARDAEKVYLRARELCYEIDELAELFTVTWGLWLLCQKRGRMQEAKAFANELLELADQLSDEEYLLQAHHAAWTTNFRLSELQSCDSHARQGLKIYNLETHRHHATRFGGHDPGVCAHYNNAMARWLLGYPDQARESVKLSVQLAEQINHPFSQVLAHVFSAFVSQCCGNQRQAQIHTQQVLKLCSTYGIAPDCAAQARVIDGWEKIQSGDLTSGVNIIEQAIIALRNTGVRTHEPYLLSILADSYAKTDQIKEGLRIISDAQNCVSETGERTFDAEVYRLQGELLLLESSDHLDTALTAFQNAIDVAQQEKARSLELRAMMSLCRAQQGKQQNQFVAQTLKPLYEGFSEGHDTADLRAAAALLSV